MRIAVVVARILLGLIFTVFGLNGFLHFIPQVAPKNPLAVQYLTALIDSHYVIPIFLLQIVCGILLLVNKYVPLALTVLAPILVNILLYHTSMDPANIAPGLLSTICWVIVFWSVRSAFSGIMRHSGAPPRT